MRLAISGTAHSGKTTLLKSFLHTWNDYESPIISYRDILKEKQLDHSKETTPETQSVILDHLVDTVQGYKIDDTVIFDGGQFGASETTQMSIVTTLGVNDEYLEQNISIYPNPTSGFVQIKIREWTSDMDYEVYNILGQTLKINRLQNNEILDLTDLSSDIYFIKITEIDTNRSLVKKIILNK